MGASVLPTNVQRQFGFSKLALPSKYCRMSLPFGVLILVGSTIMPFQTRDCHRHVSCRKQAAIARGTTAMCKACHLAQYRVVMYQSTQSSRLLGGASIGKAMLATRSGVL